PPPLFPLLPYTTLFRSRVVGLAEFDKAEVLSFLVVGRPPAGIVRPVIPRTLLFRTRSEIRRKLVRGRQLPPREAIAKVDDKFGRSEEHTSELQSPDHLV